MTTIADPAVDMDPRGLTPKGLIALPELMMCRAQHGTVRPGSAADAKFCSQIMFERART